MFLVNLKWSVSSFCSSVFILFIFSILCHFIFSFFFSYMLVCFLMIKRERKRGVDMGKWGNRKMWEELGEKKWETEYII